MGKCCGILLLLLPSGEENYSAAAYFSVLVTFFSFFRNSGGKYVCFGCYCHHPHPAAEKGCKHGSSSLPCFLPCYRKQQKLFLWWYTPVPPFPISLPEKKGNENRVLSSLSSFFFFSFPSFSPSLVFLILSPCFYVFQKKVRKERDTCTHDSFPLCYQGEIAI